MTGSSYEQLVEQLAERIRRDLALEYHAERRRRAAAHNHEYASPEEERPVLTFDLHGTLVNATGFPLTERAYKGVRDGMHTFASRGCCLHIASASLDVADMSIRQARMKMIEAWCKAEGLPIGFICPKVGADVYVDDRMVEVDSIDRIPDWDAIFHGAEKRLLKTFELAGGVYVKRKLNPVGTPIEEFPDPKDVKPDQPRGLSLPVVDMDYHRTISPAWGSGRMAAIPPQAIESMRYLYERYTIHLSCGGINPGTRELEDRRGRGAAMRLQAQREGVPYDRFVSKDDSELVFDNQGVEFATWALTVPRIDAAMTAHQEYRKKLEGPGHSNLAEHPHKGS